MQPPSRRRTAPSPAGPRVGVGLAGCGRIARAFHLPVLRDRADVDLVAVADPDPEARAAAGRLAPDAAVHADVADLLADPRVAAVVVCVPTHRHAEVATAAFAAGRDVYVEKPLAADLADAGRIRDAWRASGRRGAVGFNFRFHPQYRAARAAVADGRLGTLVAARSVFSSAPRALPDWKRRPATGGGALLDLATHHLDLLPWLLDAPVDRVAATVVSVRSEDDTALLQCTLASGAVTQTLATLSAAQSDRLELLGDAATLEVDRMGRRRPVVRAATSPTTPAQRLRAAATAVREGLASTRDGLRPPPEPSFAAALGAFCAGLATAGASSVDGPGAGGDAAARAPAPPGGAATIEDGYRVARVVEAARRAAATGATVTVAEQP